MFVPYLPAKLRLLLLALLCFFLSEAPTMATTVSLNAVADTSLYEGSPDANLGGTTLLSGENQKAERGRALFRFDLSSVPAGVTITQAQVTMTVTRRPDPDQHGGPIGSQFDLYRLLVDWGEGTGGNVTGANASPGDATWNQRHFGVDASAWASPGGQIGTDFASSASTSTFIDAVGTYTFGSSAALLADVQAWLQDPSSNFGFILLSESESSSGSARRFASREQPGGSTPPPTLTLTYGVSPIVLPATIQAQGTVGVAYSQTITATGGSGAKMLTYKITGTVPTGLQVMPASPAAGAITVSGTPTVAGSFAIDVSASDTGGSASVAGHYPVTINPALDIHPPGPLIAYVSLRFHQVIQVTGGTLPLTALSISGFNAGGTGLVASTVVADASTGTVTLDGTAPAPGQATFSINATDNVGATLLRSFAISVQPRAPLLSPDLAYGVKNTPVDINVLSNDVDPNHASLKITSITQGLHGTVSITNNGQSVRYLPAPGSVVQPDTFTYTVTDAFGQMATGTVTVGDLFRSAQGSFSGPVQPSPGIPPTTENSGSVRFTSNGVTGGFTGFIMVAGQRFTFQGSFDPAGVARFGRTGTTDLVLSRAGLPDLVLEAHLVLDSPISQLAGTLTKTGAPLAVFTAQRE